MIKRNFIDRSKETMLALYISMVRPHLEYCVRVEERNASALNDRCWSIDALSRMGCVVGVAPTDDPKMAP